MKNRVITISREFGSGGRTIGKKTAEKLGIPCYDAEIIQTMAQETGFAPDYVQEAGEYAPGGFLSSAFSNRMLGPTNEDILWEHQYKVITDLAAKGPCVIVGRCADYILQDTADCLKVFIHADMAFRAKRIVEVYGEREQSPEERLRDKDKRRAAYHRCKRHHKAPQSPVMSDRCPALPVRSPVLRHLRTDTVRICGRSRRERSVPLCCKWFPPLWDWKYKPFSAVPCAQSCRCEYGLRKPLLPVLP